jgi:hypothetical protein
MLGPVVRLLDAAERELGDKVEGAIAECQGLCHELVRFYVSIEELLECATSCYHSFESYVHTFDVLKDDASFKQSVRRKTKEVLDSLKRFEGRLKSVFVKVKLMGEVQLAVNLVQVPESSYSLFKKYFVEDLAPKFLADASGTRYVIRIVKDTKEHPLLIRDNLGNVSLDLDDLFARGVLSHETIDFRDKIKVRQIIEDCSEELKRLSDIQESLGQLIRRHCQLAEML